MRVTAQPQTHCECEVINQESVPCGSGAGGTRYPVAQRIFNLENLTFSVALRGFHKQHTIIVDYTKCKDRSKKQYGIQYFLYSPSSK